MTAQEIDDGGEVKIFGVFSGLDHHVEFASNDTINRLLFNHYRHQYCVHDDYTHMHSELQYFIDEMGDYWQKRWEAYQLEFNPLYNVDATEESCTAGKEQEHVGASSSGTEDSTANQFGYNETTPTKTGSSDTATKTQTDQNRVGNKMEHVKLRRYGNIGVVSSVKLLLEYRDEWLQSVLGDYVKTFSDFFMII